MKKAIQTEVMDSGFEVLEHSGKIIKAMKDAMADGWQTGADLPVAVTALISEMPGIITNAMNIGADASAEPVLFAKGATIAALDIVDMFIPKKA